MLGAARPPNTPAPVRVAMGRLRVGHGTRSPRAILRRPPLAWWLLLATLALLASPLTTWFNPIASRDPTVPAPNFPNAMGFAESSGLSSFPTPTFDRLTNELLAHGPKDSYRSPPLAESSINVGAGPIRESYDSGNGYVYVLNSASNNVSVIDGTSVIETVAVGADPTSSTYDNANGDVYVTNYNSDNVSVINGTKVIATMGVGNEPSSVAYDDLDHCVYVVNSGAPYSVMIFNGTVFVRTLSAGPGASYATYDGEDGWVYVLNTGASNVSVLNGQVIWDPSKSVTTHCLQPMTAGMVTSTFRTPVLTA